MTINQEPPGPPRIVENEPQASWFFYDVYGNVWKLVRTDDPAMPLIIMPEQRW